MHPNARKISFTPQGLAQVTKEHEALIAKRPEAIAELKRAREMGDLSENGAYKSARALVSQIDSRLRHLSNLIRFAQVVEPPRNGNIGLNTYVRITDDNTEREFQIVGEHESNPLEGKLSYTSPLGSVLMGKKQGDTVTVFTPKGSTVYTILSTSA